MIGSRVCIRFSVGVVGVIIPLSLPVSLHSLFQLSFVIFFVRLGSWIPCTGLLESMEIYSGGALTPLLISSKKIYCAP
jgi:hypothetical protein